MSHPINGKSPSLGNLRRIQKYHVHRLVVAGRIAEITLFIEYLEVRLLSVKSAKSVVPAVIEHVRVVRIGGGEPHLFSEL